MDIVTMHSYLQHVMEMEGYVYLWQQALGCIRDAIRQAERCREEYCELLLEDFVRHSLLHRAWEKLLDKCRKTPSLPAGIRLAKNLVEQQLRWLYEQQDAVKRLLAQATAELDALYALNVLPIDSRTFIAVSTMYDAVVDGRCTHVEGEGGLFDTYARAVQAKGSVPALEDISHHADCPRVLCAALENIQRNLQSIDADIAQICENIPPAAGLTAIDAVANQQTAMIAHSITWRTGVPVK